MTVILDSRKDFTLETARRVAWGGEAVKLGDGALAAMTEARARFMRLIDDPDVTIYGVTSGYGQNAKVRLAPDERKAHAARPPYPAAASWGDPLPDRVTRAIVFARLANFVEGHAAVSPHVAEAVAAMLDGGPLPMVPARGQGGAGEIVSLSPLFASMAADIELGEKDALSLINGSPSATALVTDTALAGSARLDIAMQVFAFAAEAFNIPLSHVDETLESLWNNPHDAWALKGLRDLIDGGHGGERRPYQAPVSFRILPRMLGAAHRAVTLAQDVAAESLAAVSDNPVVVPPDDDHPLGRAFSTGGYHNAQATMAMDMVTAQTANLCVIAERLSAKLLDGPVSLLPPQLDPESDRIYLGCLPMAAVGYEEEARMLAQATLLPGSESGGFGQNDVASPVFLAWSKQDRAGLLLELALAGLAIIALRAYDVTGRPVPPKLAALKDLVRAGFDGKADRFQPGPAAGAIAQRLRDTIYRA